MDRPTGTGQDALVLSGAWEASAELRTTGAGDDQSAVRSAENFRGRPAVLARSGSCARPSRAAA
jgi:hypothetical protein